MGEKVKIFLHTWLGIVISAISGVIWLVFELLNTGLIKINPAFEIAVRILAILFIIGGFIYQSIKPQLELNRIYSSKPSIDLGDIRVLSRDFQGFMRLESSTNDKDIYLGGTIPVLHYLPSVRQLYGSTDSLASFSDPIYLGVVDIVNNTKGKENVNDAERVVGEIKYFDSSGKLLLDPVYGRWSDLPEPSLNVMDRKPDYEYEQINIPANGQPRGLCLIVKKRGEKYCKAYSLDTYKHGLRSSEFTLSSRQVIIELTVSGSNLKPKNFWFMVTNINFLGGFNIREIEPPSGLLFMS